MEPVSSWEELELLLDAKQRFNEVRLKNFEWMEPSESLDFDHCEFQEMVFRDTHWTDIHFSHCEFDRCHFDSAQLTDCVFDHCKFYNREEEAGCSFKFAAFPGTIFKQSDLTMCNFSRTNLYRIEMEQCQATGMDCSYSTSSQSIGGNVVMNSARLCDCNFSYADFTGSSFCEAELHENRFSHALFNRANFEGAEFNDCDLHGIEATDVTIRGADLRGAQISGLDIRQIDMNGVKINDYQQPILLSAIGIEVD